MNKQAQKLWGSAFDQNPSDAVIAFTAGRDVAGVAPADINLLPYDIWVNQVHCLMLVKQGIIPIQDGKFILKGLQEVQKLAEKGEFELNPTKEDVHTNIESWLTQKLGIEVAGKLHTARSRNDQANCDTRLYLRDQVLNFVKGIIPLVETLLGEADKHSQTIMPGFTHHQHAMVTTWGHTLQAFAAMLTRDLTRFTHWYELHNLNPLGNSVAYGTIFPLDRDYTAKLMGFTGVEANSLDEITNRWEAEADLTFAISILMNHLSLIAQTLILFATPEFGFVKLADSFSTGSSIMPQKKNPDPLEVVKAKASYALGQLVSLLGMGKANFIGFNRDSQWTKYVVMDVVRECLPAPTVMKGVLETLTVNQEVMEKWSHKAFIGTTSLLEKMTNEFKLPFRLTKIVLEKAVRYSQGEDKVNYAALLKALKEVGIDIKITRQEVRSWQHPAEIIKDTNSDGGPGFPQIEQSSQVISNQIKKVKNWHQKKINEKLAAKKLLETKITEILEGKV